MLLHSPANLPDVQQILPEPQLVLVQTHFPLEHDGVVPEQTLPHEPQLLAVLSAVHAPLQQPCPVAQVTPHAPQLLVVLRATHTPLQQPWPVVHCTHVTPPVPHVCVVVPLWHVLF